MNSQRALFEQASLCIVGNINCDIKTSPFAAGQYLFQDGETSVGRVVETIGGGGANCAFAAASLGARVGFVGKVGCDPLAQRIKAALAKAGINDFLNEDESVATGRSIALTFDNGHRHFVSSLPNNEALGWEDVRAEAIAKYRHLLRADIWFSEKMLYGGNRILLQTARETGVATSIDLNWDPKWASASRDEIASRKKAVREILPWVNMAHGNANEINIFCDSDDLNESLKRLEQWGVEETVVHMGKDGAALYAKGQLIAVGAAPVGQIVQSTGTGDVLSVCMMLLKENDSMGVAEKLRTANEIVAAFMEGKRSLLAEL